MARYYVTVFLSAFLLFQVQPIMGKQLLPWYGGGAAVWNSCMLFFQALLLGGYAYAHVLSTRFSAKIQSRVHVVLLLFSCVLSPVLLSDSMKPTDSTSPVLGILTRLLFAIGGPYLMLASTGPLLQRWFYDEHPQQSPWRLYALSNAGSLLALLSYPLVVEPQVGMQVQASSWSWMYIAFALLSGWTALRSVKVARTNHSSDAAASNSMSASQTTTVSERPSIWLMLLWLLTAATASIMLLATTNQMCIDLASVPLLWILPLAIYLISFIICFDNTRWYDRRIFGVLLFVAFVVACQLVMHSSDMVMHVQISLYSFVLFCVCMVCHGELVLLRPSPQYLTKFYLTVSAGGVVGGAMVAIGAPLIFDGFHEFHFGLILAAIAASICWSRTRWTWQSETPVDAMSWLRAIVSITQIVLLANFYHPIADDIKSTNTYAALGLLVGLLLVQWTLIRYTSLTSKSARMQYLVLAILNAIISFSWVLYITAPDSIPGNTKSSKSILLGLIILMEFVGVLLSLVFIPGTTARRRIMGYVLVGFAPVLSLVSVYLLWHYGVVSKQDSLIAGGFFVAIQGLSRIIDRLWQRGDRLNAAPLSRTMRSGEMLGGSPWGRWLASFAALTYAIGAFMFSEVRSDSTGRVHVSRNFYGVLRVAYESDSLGAYHQLTHGGTNHGMQYLDEPWRSSPTTYYAMDSGIGLAMLRHPGRLAAERGEDLGLNVGVVGLGTGTLATYGREGDHIRFFEIDPAVIPVTKKFFTHLIDSQADVDIRLGDARISLEREVDTGAPRYDVLAIDAFSSDAIPMHLLTIECADIYRQRLKPDGILVVHISNRYLDLNPITRAMAEHLGWEAIRVDVEGDETIGTYGSVWIVITSNREFLDDEQIQFAHSPWSEYEPRPLAWTDDFGSLWHVIDF